nr:MAG TPA: hypothetical protein [Caudoviricetes sp.]
MSIATPPNLYCKYNAIILRFIGVFLNLTKL